MLSRHMAINVEVEKSAQESTANLIRRFTKRVQGSGIINRLRKNRYHKRDKSRLVNKMGRLKKLAKKQIYEKMLKLGKVQEHRPRR